MVSKWNTCISKATEAVTDLRGEFARMIAVDRDEKWVVFFQHITKFWSDALRKEDGNARTDADELNVRDRSKTRQDFIEAIVREEQGIPARKKNIADLAVLFEVTKSGFPLSFEMLFADARNDT